MLAFDLALFTNIFMLQKYRPPAWFRVQKSDNLTTIAGLDIGPWQPLARGASESENPLALQKNPLAPQKHAMTQICYCGGNLWFHARSCTLLYIRPIYNEN